MLRASPYFQGIYECLDGVHEVAIEGGFIVPKKGFAHSIPLRVSAEELFYNKKYLPFRVLLISGVLDWGPDQAGRIAKGANSNPRLSFGRPAPQQLFTLSAHTEFIQTQTTVDDFRALQSELATFSDAYVVVEGYLDDARSQLQELCRGLTDRVLNGSGLRLNAKEARTQETIRQSIECMAFTYVSSNLRRALVTEHQADIQVLASRINLYAHTSSPDDGVLPPALKLCEFAEAVHILQQLSTYTTPLEKADCMHRCMSAASREVEELQQQHQVLSADDMIPILAIVILRARLETLSADVAVASYFGLSLQANSELGYSLVSFQAALQYLMGEASSRTASFSSTSSPRGSNAQVLVGDPTRPGWRKVKSLTAERSPSPALGATATPSPRPARRDVPPPPIDVVDAGMASATQEDMGSFLSKLSLGF